jgi:pimeloyl-ACP methyl ester carboxylesterase
MWRQIMPALAERYTVVAPDLRGAGGTAITAGGYDRQTLAQDVRGLVRQLELGDVSLVGHDHGAGVAYAYARLHEAEVRRMADLEHAAHRRSRLELAGRLLHAARGRRADPTRTGARAAALVL